ncbi:hypothetical protein [Tahibacter soli]|uniref:Delta-60 repeat protein n=1 Tax=Tahibacter soli TaxID=2983605 RepID=A0A9X3YI10_9GAMM|nr:hypothetical protein [Tahibacter soli]MDC8012666.1 hypothetical protein [Tahibacter soli]
MHRNTPHRRTLAVLICGLFAAAASPGFAADGQLDPAFGTGGTSFILPDGVQAHEFRTTVSTVLADGSILVGGTRNKIFQNNPDPHMRAVLVRLLPDGTPDPAFGNLDGIPGVHEYPDLVPGDQQQIIEAMRVLEDGSIVVAGSANAFGPLTGFVLKVGANGELDATFDEDGIALIPGVFLHGLAIDAAGRVIVGGERATPSLDSAILARLNADGTRDTTFGTNGIVTLDTGANSTYFTTLTLDAAGRILVTGQAATPDFTYDAHVTRLTADGALDPTFAGGGMRRFTPPGHAASTYNGVDNLVLDARGRITVSAYYNTDENGVNVALGRLDADGTDDPSFGSAATPGWRDVDLVPGAWGRYVSGLALQSDGKLVFSVSYAAPKSKQGFMALRTNADGSADTSFGTNGKFEVDLAPNGIYSDSTALVLQAGKPVITGQSARTTGSNLLDFAAVRLDGDLIFADRLGD